MRSNSLRLNLTLTVLTGVVCWATPVLAQSVNLEPMLETAPIPTHNPAPATMSQAPEQKARGPEQRLSPDYVIGPEDLLTIDVFEVPELNKSVRVANDGTISLALLGRLYAAGLTVQQLRKELEEKWGQKYLVNPQVSVFVAEYHSQPVSVIGAVERPGVYELRGPRTLIEMLSLAGGMAKQGMAPGRTLMVTRKGGFTEDFRPLEGMTLIAPDKVEIDLQRLLYSRDEGLNIDVKPFDVIAVSKADIVYVVGDVKKPGGYVLGDHRDLTVLQVLALAEGTTGTASKGAARIIRTSESGSRTEIPVDLTKILKGKSQDVKLVANDILFVPTSSGKAAAKRGVEAVLGTVSGMLIYRRL